MRANFFCPGHKQGTRVHQSFRDLLAEGVLKADLPELPALDNLFAPEGVIEESQELAANTFTEEGSDQWSTYFLVNGTTCGIEAAIMTCLKPGHKIVLPRNVHQSAVHALVMSGAIPVWIDPQYDPQLDLLHGVTAAGVAKAFDDHRGEIDAVLIVSPTYHGVCSNVDAIAAVTHDYGAFLIVDEAHGAHFSFHRLLPKSSTHTEADIVIQSTHKTLTAFSQAAMLHARKDSIDTQKISSALQVVQSTSPNYLLLASLEATRALMDEQGEDLMSRTIDLARNCAVRIASLEGFSVLGVEDVGYMSKGSPKEELIYDLDSTRVTVLLPHGMSGYDIDTHLIDCYGVYAELPSFRHITFVFSPGSSQLDVDTLVTSLSLYKATAPENIPDAEGFGEKPKCNVTGMATSVTPREAFFATSEVVDTDDAIDRITVETLSPYPPGIPVLVAGERVTQESVDMLKAVIDKGGSVSGASDESLSSIRVIARDEESSPQRNR